MWPQIFVAIFSCFFAYFVEAIPMSGAFHNNFTAMFNSEDDSMLHEVALGDPENLHEYQKTKLTENEIIREAIYERYFPFFILSGVSFVILSGVWILYNILSYTRKQNKIKKLERLNRQQESKRLLQLYHQVPVETT